jgi:hypothetical protein
MFSAADNIGEIPRLKPEESDRGSVAIEEPSRDVESIAG